MINVQNIISVILEFSKHTLNKINVLCNVIKDIKSKYSYFKIIIKVCLFWDVRFTFLASLIFIILRQKVFELTDQLTLFLIFYFQFFLMLIQFFISINVGVWNIVIQNNFQNSLSNNFWYRSEKSTVVNKYILNVESSSEIYMKWIKDSCGCVRKYRPHCNRKINNGLEHGILTTCPDSSDVDR